MEQHRRLLRACKSTVLLLSPCDSLTAGQACGERGVPGDSLPKAGRRANRSNQLLHRSGCGRCGCDRSFPVEKGLGLFMMAAWPVFQCSIPRRELRIGRIRQISAACPRGIPGRWRGAGDLTADEFSGHPCIGNALEAGFVQPVAVITAHSLIWSKRRPLYHSLAALGLLSERQREKGRRSWPQSKSGRCARWSALTAWTGRMACWNLNAKEPDTDCSRAL